MSDEFLDLACLTYRADVDHPQRWSDAVGLAHPVDSLAMAAAVGDPDAVVAWLSADAANHHGSPRAWPPLMYLVYSRVPQLDAVAAATALLDAGAEPGWRWGEWDTPFTPLTGCFGEGEGGPFRQPPHPRGEELAALLIERGADVDDEQTLYNRMFARDDDHLRFLLAHGLSDPEMLADQVGWALDHGLTDRVALLAEHGFTERSDRWRRPDDDPPIARVGTPDAVRAFTGDVNARFDGETALHHWAWLGDVEMVRALLDAGADPTARSDAFDATPLGHAEWACADATAELLRSDLRGGR